MISLPLKAGPSLNETQKVLCLLSIFVLNPNLKKFTGIEHKQNGKLVFQVMLQSEEFTGALSLARWAIQGT